MDADLRRSRDRVHARHAKAYPAALMRNGDWTGFAVVLPTPEGRGVLAVAASPRKLSCLHDPARWPPRDDMASWPRYQVGSDLVIALGMLGVGRGHGTMPVADDGGPPVLQPLKEALVAAWAEDGCLGDESEASFEAMERERARLDEAGLNEFLAALPKGVGRILDAKGDIFGDRTWSGRFLEFALARDGRSAAIAALGDLMDLVGTGEADEDPADYPDPASYVMERIARWPTRPLDGGGTPTPADAEWLLSRFSRVEPRGDLASAVPVRWLRELLAHRAYIEPQRLKEPADSAALVDLLSALDDGGLAYPRFARVLRVLSMTGGESGYGALARKITEAGGGGAKGFRKGCERLLLDGDALRRAFRDAVLFPRIARALHGVPEYQVDGAALAARSALHADDAVFAGRGLAEVAPAALAWRRAGSPGRSREPVGLWQDMGDFGGEARERLVEAADPTVGPMDLEPFLGDGWQGELGEARTAAAVADILSACDRRGEPAGTEGTGDADVAEAPEPAKGGFVRRVLALVRR